MDDFCVYVCALSCIYIVKLSYRDNVLHMVVRKGIINLLRVYFISLELKEVVELEYVVLFKQWICVGVIL